MMRWNDVSRITGSSSMMSFRYDLIRRDMSSRGSSAIGHRSSQGREEYIVGADPPFPFLIPSSSSTSRPHKPHSVPLNTPILNTSTTMSDDSARGPQQGAVSHGHLLPCLPAHNSSFRSSSQSNPETHLTKDGKPDHRFKENGGSNHADGYIEEGDGTSRLVTEKGQSSTDQYKSVLFR